MFLLKWINEKFAKQPYCLIPNEENAGKVEIIKNPDSRTLLINNLDKLLEELDELERIGKKFFQK